MARKKAQLTPESESGRESRVKLILLVVALVLVAGYAALTTDLTRFVLNAIHAAASSGAAILAMAGIVAVASIATLGVLYVRRRKPKAKAKAASSEPMGTPVKLAGRAEFLKALSGYLEAHGRSGRQLALHLIDIDRFRVLNEVLGEAEGDAFLRQVVERLLVLVNHQERIARIGDDEFAIIQPEAGGARHAEIYARRIEETVKDACAQVPRHARPGASIGIAVYPDHGGDPAKLLHSASLALRAAKTDGGGLFRVYSREMEMVVEARLQMEKAIGDGLHEGWFDLHFQPQYDLLSRRLTGFEALVRMNHPELGHLLPASFLPVAEESGLIQPLGEWIIREALTTAAEWPEHLTLSINVSREQFRHGDVAAVVINALSQSGVEGSRLRVEIPEALLLDQSEAVEDQLRRLKGRGVTIVLDDFGVDSSRLKSLSRLACDAVKLDKSLVEHVGEQPEIENLVRSLIGTAQSFDLAVQAEGIERAEQAHFLMSNDCQNVQGYLFGRPAEARELGSIIAKDLRKAAHGGERPAPLSHSARSVA